MKYIFAGDRDISVEILKFMMEGGYKPSALLVTEKSKASHADKLIKLSGLKPENIFEGKSFTQQDTIAKLRAIEAKYIIGIHFPYIIPQEVLDIPSTGFLNLHPAYLPYNKGWHTPSWAILDETPYGATLHFMSKELDKGDILHQKKIQVNPEDTANSLYQRVKELEIEVFKEAFPTLLNNPRKVKQTDEGTMHVKKQLAAIQKLHLNEMVTTGDLLKKLKALTTNEVKEAAYFEIDNKKYFIQVVVTPDNNNNNE